MMFFIISLGREFGKNSSGNGSGKRNYFRVQLTELWCRTSC